MANFSGKLRDLKGKGFEEIPLNFRYSGLLLRLTSAAVTGCTST